MAAAGWLLQPLGAVVTLIGGLLVYGGVILIGWYIDSEIYKNRPAGN
jgi:hypothetical protein